MCFCATDCDAQSGARAMLAARLGYAVEAAVDFKPAKEDWNMLRMLLHWIFNAVALLIVARYVQGFEVSNLVSALIAVIVIGLFNATFGLLLKIITLPLSIITFGLFLLVINAVMLKFSSEFVPGFRVETFKAAFLGALALAVLHLIFGLFTRSSRSQAT